jgi:Nuclease-related domain
MTAAVPQPTALLAASPRSVDARNRTYAQNTDHRPLSEARARSRRLGVNGGGSSSSRPRGRYLRVPEKLFSFRYPSRCRQCGVELPAHSKGWYDRETKAATCMACHESGVHAARSDSTSGGDGTVRIVDTGTAGAGPQREYERRNAKREDHLDRKWGRLAPIAKFLSDEPQHITAFNKGADGERRLGAHLQREVGDYAFFLHSRRIDKGDIDHLAIAPTGVYVIDAKNYTGRVEARDVGNWRTIDRRLFVGGRDKSKLVDGMNKQTTAVRAVLDNVELTDVEIHPVLCFTDSEWGCFAKPLGFGNVTCLWAKKLCEMIKRPGPLNEPQRQSIAYHLSINLPATD